MNLRRQENFLSAIYYSCPVNIMRKIVSVIETITTVFGGYLPAWTVFLLMLMVLVEVIGRYILQAPLSIADEIGGFMLVGITFVGLGYTWKERSHVSVEILTNILPVPIKKWFRFFTLILATLFCWPLIAGSYELLQDSILFGARSGSWIRTPLVYPQSLLLIGSVLLFLQLIAEIIKSVMEFLNPGGEKI